MESNSQFGELSGFTITGDNWLLQEAAMKYNIFQESYANLVLCDILKKINQGWASCVLATKELWQAYI